MQAMLESGCVIGDGGWGVVQGCDSQEAARAAAKEAEAKEAEAKEAESDAESAQAAVGWGEGARED